MSEEYRLLKMLRVLEASAGDVDSIPGDAGDVDLNSWDSIP